jgi:catechol 2,3-dioxygenase-like lactoylglutathione lyase family enzyme
MNPDYVLLYVDNPAASAAFYADLLSLQPVQTSPTFVLFVLPSGLKLGLWSRHTAEPKVLAYGGGSELAFAVPDRSVVNDLHADWAARPGDCPAPHGDGLWLHLRRPRPRRPPLRVLALEK